MSDYKGTVTVYLRNGEVRRYLNALIITESNQVIVHGGNHIIASFHPSCVLETSNDYRRPWWQLLRVGL